MAMPCDDGAILNGSCSAPEHPDWLPVPDPTGDMPKAVSSCRPFSVFRCLLSLFCILHAFSTLESASLEPSSPDLTWAGQSTAASQRSRAVKKSIVCPPSGRGWNPHHRTAARGERARRTVARPIGINLTCLDADDVFLNSIIPLVHFSFSFFLSFLSRPCRWR